MGRQPTSAPLHSKRKTKLAKCGTAVKAAHGMGHPGSSRSRAKRYRCENRLRCASRVRSRAGRAQAPDPFHATGLRPRAPAFQGLSANALGGRPAVAWEERSLPRLQHLAAGAGVPTRLGRAF